MATNGVADTQKMDTSENQLRVPGEFPPPWADCSVCKRSPTVPEVATLPCGHLACSEACLEKILQNNTGPYCPMCRYYVDKEEVCSCTYINDIIESFSKEQDKGKDKSSHENQICKSCVREAKAHRWCVECQEFLCEFCCEHHQFSKATRGHSLAPTSEGIVELPDGSEESICGNRCQLHGEELVSYCLDCESMNCAQCVSQNHKKCKVKDLNTVAKQVKENFENSLNSITYLKKRNAEAINLLTGRVEFVLNEQKDTIYKELRDSFQQIVEGLIKREMEIREELVATTLEKAKELNIKKANATYVSSQCAQYFASSREIMQKGSSWQILQHKKSIDRLRLELQELADAFKDEAVFSDYVEDQYCFSIDRKPVEVVLQCLEQLGRIKYDNQSAEAQSEPVEEKETSEPGKRPNSVKVQPLPEVAGPQQPKVQSPPKEATKSKVQSPIEMAAPTRAQSPAKPSTTTNEALGKSTPALAKLATAAKVPVKPAAATPALAKSTVAAAPDVSEVPVIPKASVSASAETVIQDESVEIAIIEELDSPEKTVARVLRGSVSGAATPARSPVKPAPVNDDDESIHSETENKNIHSDTEHDRAEEDHSMSESGNESSSSRSSRVRRRAIKPMETEEQKPEAAAEGRPRRAAKIPRKDETTPTPSAPSTPSDTTGRSTRSRLTATEEGRTKDNCNMTLNLATTTPRSSRVGTSASVSPENSKETPESSKRPARSSSRSKLATPADQSVEIIPEIPIVQEEKMKITNSDPNEDYCSVCLDGGGEVLICCDVCPKVFHLFCHMPEIDEIPQNDWQCLFCSDLSTVVKEHPSTQTDGSHLSERDFYTACKFLSEVYQIRESLTVRNVYEVLFEKYMNQPPLSLQDIRRKLTQKNPDRFTNLRDFVQMLRKLLYQANFFYGKTSKENQAYLQSFERTFNELLKSYFPLLINVKYDPANDKKAKPLKLNVSVVSKLKQQGSSATDAKK